MTTRLYANDDVRSSDDVMLMKHYGVLKKLDEEKNPAYEPVSKAVSNNLRLSLGIENVVGLALNKEETEVIIFIYDIPATPDNFFNQNFDHEAGKPYIEV